jgi:threonine/homoserine/homoserine lactone efflux protein
LVVQEPFLFCSLRYGSGANLIWRGFRMIRNAGRAASYSAPVRAPENGSIMLQFIFLGIIMRIVALMTESGITFFAKR